MRVIEARNVEEALRMGVGLLGSIGERLPSRAGAVLVAPHPVMTVYHSPMERVLLCQHRDANPFFHLFESLWMLSGSNDARWLDRFVSDFSSRFGEPGSGEQWGAYGYRWRRHWDTDQLEAVIRRLSRDPYDRRVVIGMWDPTYDLIDPAEMEEGGREPRDLPCNTHLYPRIRADEYGQLVLDLTICCRSNDIIWGAYGANAVHFSVLQEYLAHGLSARVGRMYQLSNNWHAYVDVFDRVARAQQEPVRHAYPMETVGPEPMFDKVLPLVQWDHDLGRFLEDPERDEEVYGHSWFGGVAARMWRSHECYRRRDYEGALNMARSVMASDWRLAATEWIVRRMSRTRELSKDRA